MADIAITAASVLKSTSSVIEGGTAGATITAGQTVYKDASDSNKVKLADANASDATAACVGIALNGAASGQPISFATSGPYTAGGTLTAGAVYVLSATAGAIAPVADLTTGWRTTILGVATSTTVLDLRIYASNTTN